MVGCFSFSFVLGAFDHVLEDGYDGVFMSLAKAVHAVCDGFETQRSVAEDSDEGGFNLLRCGRLGGRCGRHDEVFFDNLRGLFSVWLRRRRRRKFEWDLVERGDGDKVFVVRWKKEVNKEEI